MQFSVVKRLWVLLFFWYAGNTCNGQYLPFTPEKSSKQVFETAQNYYDFKQFKEALPLFSQLLTQDPDNSNLNFLIGDCLTNEETSAGQAVSYFEKAIRNTTLDYVNGFSQRYAPVYAYYKLADVLYNNYKFDEAVINYKIFKSYLTGKKDKELLDEVNKRIELCNTAKTLIGNSIKVNFTEIPNLNAVSSSTYGAQMTENGNIIYFSRKRSGNGANISSDIYVMKKEGEEWSRPIRLSNINSEASDDFCSISRDGGTMIFSSNREGKFNLYLAEKVSKSQWTNPVKLNANVNSLKNNETFGCVSPDSKSLYFVSDRKGGYGGKDIYKSEKGEDDDWGPAVNLGPKINTPYDEDSPFISDDNKTLYFSSKGHQSMGGYDIFYARLLTNKTWSEPTNMGYPVNTLGDDLFFNKSKAETTFYTSSNKAGYGEYSIYPIGSFEPYASKVEAKAKPPAAQQEKTKPIIIPKVLKY